MSKSYGCSSVFAFANGCMMVMYEGLLLAQNIWICTEQPVIFAYCFLLVNLTHVGIEK